MFRFYENCVPGFTVQKQTHTHLYQMSVGPAGHIYFLRYKYQNDDDDDEPANVVATVAPFTTQLLPL